MLHSFGHLHVPTKLALWVSVSMAIIYCLYLPLVLPRECSRYSMANEQSSISQRRKLEHVSLHIEREMAKY